jgi:hypothetical protein
MLGGGNEGGRRAASQRANADCERLAPFVVNADGSLAKADLETGLTAEYKKWDKNGDGQMSQAEAGPLNDQLRALKVGASPVMDWNGDGRIAFDEFAGGWRTMFDLCGGEKNGVVTKADMTRSPNVTTPRDAPAGRPEGASSPTAGGGY